MDSRDYMKAYGEWLCSIVPSPMVKSLMHGSMSAMYQRDYIVVTNLCDGFLFLPKISISIVDGAKKHYKEINNSALEAFPLSDEIKKEVSAQIDFNAEEQKKRWINILQVKGISITN
ncbi:MAG: hypothetical protein K2M93_05915 [Muribaculaceae bacterium]|nr:hypothetical protein [Muribaculaceae bacterium]